MSIADNSAQRAAWLARVARIQGEIADLRTEIDVAFQAQRPPSTPTMHRMAEADTHLNVAAVELAEASARIRQLP